MNFKEEPNSIYSVNPLSPGNTLYIVARGLEDAIRLTNKVFGCAPTWNVKLFFYDTIQSKNIIHPHLMDKEVK